MIVKGGSDGPILDVCVVAFIVEFLPFRSGENTANKVGPAGERSSG